MIPVSAEFYRMATEGGFYLPEGAQRLELRERPDGTHDLVFTEEVRRGS